MSFGLMLPLALCRIQVNVVWLNVAFGVMTFDELMSFGLMSFGLMLHSAMSFGLMSFGLLSFGLMLFSLLPVYQYYYGINLDGNSTGHDDEHIDNNFTNPEDEVSTCQ